MMEIKPETLRKLRERLDGYHARHKMVPKSGQGQFEAQIDIEWPRISKALEEIDALLDERDRLKAAMATAGLECFMSDATPQQVADHMRAVSASWEGQLARNEKLEAVLVTAKDAISFVPKCLDIVRESPKHGDCCACALHDAITAAQ